MLDPWEDIKLKSLMRMYIPVLWVIVWLSAGYIIVYLEVYGINSELAAIFYSWLWTLDFCQTISLILMAFVKKSKTMGSAYQMVFNLSNPLFLLAALFLSLHRNSMGRGVAIEVQRQQSHMGLCQITRPWTLFLH